MDIALQKEGSCDVALPFELIQSNGHPIIQFAENQQ
jgi:hypothetical protein